MRPTHLLPLLAPLLLVACASSAVSPEEADWQEARQTNTLEGYMAFLSTYPETEHRDEAMGATDAILRHRIEAQKIRDAWPRLAKGMTLDEVDELVGPIDAVSLQSFAEGIELGREYGMTDGTNTLINQSPAGVYRLVFDSNGKLTEWNWQ